MQRELSDRTEKIIVFQLPLPLSVYHLLPYINDYPPLMEMLIFVMK
jgi:hypothetical protein